MRDFLVSNKIPAALQSQGTAAEKGRRREYRAAGTGPGEQQGCSQIKLTVNCISQPERCRFSVQSFLLLLPEHCNHHREKDESGRRLHVAEPVQTKCPRPAGKHGRGAPNGKLNPDDGGGAGAGVFKHTGTLRPQNGGVGQMVCFEGCASRGLNAVVPSDTFGIFP